MPDKPINNSPQGGFAFFFSYVCLIVLAVSNMRIVVQILPEADIYDLTLLGSGLILGWWAAFTFFRGQISVLIHEYKHAILATIIGNKWKKIKLKGMSGVFHYTYTRDTKEFNAFISLAPYFLPVFTLTAVVFFAIMQSHDAAFIVVGALHGAELYFNLRDASPIQTDLTGIRGGYWVALGYIFAANIVITSSVFIWLIGGELGLELWLESIWNLGFYLIAVVRAALLPSEAGA